MPRAVFLDRDGVLNEAMVRDGRPYPPSNESEFRIYPEAAQVCASLRSAGFLLLVVTNQPDVARGKQQRWVVDRFHEKLRAQLPLDDILTCFHDDGDGCACRKPAPGLLLEAARLWSADLATSFMVGDRWRDIEAGRRAGCATVFIERGYSEALLSAPTMTVRSLEGAGMAILRNVSGLQTLRS